MGCRGCDDGSQWTTFAAPLSCMILAGTMMRVLNMPDGFVGCFPRIKTPECC
jgi:hypothetical protein